MRLILIQIVGFVESDVDSLGSCMIKTWNECLSLPFSDIKEQDGDVGTDIHDA